MVGEIISEWRATSNRNGGRNHSGIVGDIERNHKGRYRALVTDINLKGRWTAGRLLGTPERSNPSFRLFT
jgi:hypothetical protein